MSFKNTLALSLLLMAGVYGIYGCQALFNPQYMRHLAGMSLAAALTTALALPLEVAPAAIFTQINYDTLSLAYVVFLSLVAAGATMLVPLFEMTSSLRRRFFYAIIAVVLVLSSMWMTFPKFFKGPLVDADPTIKTTIFDVVGEAKPLLALSLHSILTYIGPIIVALVITGFTYLQRRQRKWPDTMLAWLMMLTFGMILVQVRWFYYILPVALVVLTVQLPPFLKWKRIPMPELINKRNKTENACVFLFSLTLLLNLICSSGSATGGAPQHDAVLGDKDCYSELMNLIQSGKITRDLGPSNIILLTSPGAGGEVQFFTPYKIIAAFYHREGPGLHDLHDIETAKTAAEAQPLLRKRGVGGMLICRSLYGKESWLHGLDQSRKVPSWLKNIPLVIPASLDEKPLLYRIRAR